MFVRKEKRKEKIYKRKLLKDPIPILRPPTFLCVKSNDSITDLYIQYQLNKLITITDNLFLSLIYNVYI